MPTTSNFGWTTPADTDLVKDGAAAIRTLGNGIDASLVDLKGGTTGQILSKNSNTDLDYTWINNDQGDITAVTAGTGLTGGGTTGAVTLTNDMATTITAAGDIVVGTGSGTYDNLPIGTTGQVLTADTTVSPYKVKWAAASSGGMTLLSTTTLSGSTTTISSISGDYIDLYVVIENLTKSAGENVKIFINNDSNQNYYAITYTGSGTTFGSVSVYKEAFSSLINPGNTEQDLRYDGIVYFYNYASTGQKKKVDRYNFHTDDGSPGTTLGQGVASYWWNSTNAINELKFDATSGTFSGGTVKIYGVK